MALERHLILKAITQAGLVRTHACCGVDDKFCNSDEWRGNLEDFANAIVRLASSKKNVWLPERSMGNYVYPDGSFICPVSGRQANRWMACPDGVCSLRDAAGAPVYYESAMEAAEALYDMGVGPYNPESSSC